jgi:histidyl-tRNA synthetase
LGIERLLLLIHELGLPVPDASPAAYAVIADAALVPQAMPVLEALRTTGLAIQMHAGGGSLKSQFKKAAASGARYALVFGGDEVARGVVGVKPLRDATLVQVDRPLADVAAWAATLHRTARDA